MGAQLFSVKKETDELVRIDSETGVITTVGETGFDFQGGGATTMTTMDGIIYATDQLDPGHNLDGMVLVALDPNTGAAISSTPLFFDDNGTDTYALFGESLTAADGQLIFGWGGAGVVASSTALINPATGEVTDSQHHGPSLHSLATKEPRGNNMPDWY